MAYCNFNGSIVEEEEIRISPDNRAFKFADGFFETMKFFKGTIILREHHLERLYSTLEKLKFPVANFPNAQDLAKQVLKLAELNNYSSARIRVTIFAGNGALNDLSGRTPSYIIQTLPLPQSDYILNDKGITIDFYQDAIKPCDQFSSLKTNNFLPYVMASIWCKEKGLDDAILLNQSGTVADATIANVFIIKDDYIITPSLQNGPVAGVMRKYLLKCFKDEAIPCKETVVTIEDVLQASEVFLTNAITGIRWVEKIGDSNYTNLLSKKLYTNYIAKLSQ